MRASYTAFDRTMLEWRDSLISWRCALSAAGRRKYGAPDGWDCRDLKFFVGRINFDQFGKQRAERVEMVVAAGCDTLRANTMFQALLSTFEARRKRVLARAG
jgi:hypothetical protein